MILDGLNERQKEAVLYNDGPTNSTKHYIFFNRQKTTKKRKIPLSI